MNRWALMLAEAPPTLQRLIARRQRISLPPEVRAWQGALSRTGDRRPGQHQRFYHEAHEEHEEQVRLQSCPSANACGICVSSAASAFPSRTSTDQGRTTTDEGQNLNHEAHEGTKIE